MSTALESYINRTVAIITSDGRMIVGTLKGFDQTINLILDESHERVFSSTQGVEQGGSWTVYSQRRQCCSDWRD
ncbi:hypothetical protein AALO_G00222890 [Alosa alosa]|uniref:U6 snRNA-associated Sm-like protein LSm8 n=1 Tax=Alosa alosa TaxID=278164 RepID=A0AAV6G0Q8_9TELE|nr:hypothetical protein AALO_G00222890 [Alosa alosa]